MTYDPDAPVYDDVLADARADFAANPNAFPDDEPMSLRQFCIEEGCTPDGHYREDG